MAKGPVRLGVFVQLAGDGDDVTDASVPWPEDRPEVHFGTVTLTDLAGVSRGVGVAAVTLAAIIGFAAATRIEGARS